MKTGVLLRVAVAALGVMLMVSCADEDGTTTSGSTPTDASQEPTMPDEPSSDDTPPTTTPPTTPPSTPPTTPPRRTPPPRLTPLPDPDTGTPSTGEVPAEYLDPVIADAAGRAGVAPDDVQINRAQAKQWPDGSLGCPQPGQMYTQAIVDGYWVELNAGGEHYDYRLNQRGTFRLCTSPTLQPPGDRTS